MTKGASRPLFLFYLLVVYVLLQFSWWTYLIIDLNNQVYKERFQAIEQNEVVDQQKSVLHKKWLMIGGEAFVFFTLLLTGMYMVRKSLQKEGMVIRQQKNFLLSVTHELKSPLASVRLQAETLKKHQLSREKQEQVISSTLQDIDRLDQLVENILLVTRIDNPNFPVACVEVNLSDYILECTRNFKTLFTDALVNTQVTEGLYACIDPLLFRSIILNLLENAYKYGSKEIGVEVLEKGNRISIMIRDHGPGIPSEERENIFRIFYRIGNEETRKSRGTGLGLYIVKTIVERHNGTIIIRDNSPKGTVFEINLPEHV